MDPLSFRRLDSDSARQNKDLSAIAAAK